MLANDGALGEGDLATSNPNQGFGFNFISTADNRKIANESPYHPMANSSRRDQRTRHREFRRSFDRVFRGHQPGEHPWLDQFAARW